MFSGAFIHKNGVLGMDLLVTFLPAAAVIVWFAVSLYLYLQTPKNDPKKRVYYIMLIVSGVLMGIAVLGFIAFMWFVYTVSEFFSQLF